MLGDVASEVLSMMAGAKTAVAEDALRPEFSNFTGTVGIPRHIRGF
jgi:hypothetical protein